MDGIKTVKFIDHKAAVSRPGHYVGITVDVAAVMESWRGSLMSFEWLDEEGRIKPVESLKDADQARFDEISAAYEAGKPLEKPVLGIGLADNVEIGAGRAVFLTLAALGVHAIEVHIPKSNESDFKDYIVAV